MIQDVLVNTGAARLAEDSARPFVIFGSPFVAEISLQDGTGGTVSPDPDAEYTLTVDDDYRFTGDEVMAFGFGSITGGTAISFTLDTMTTKYQRVIDGRPARRAYWQLNEKSGTTTRVLAQDWLEARGSVSPVDGTVTRIDPIVERAEAAANVATTAANVATTAAQSAEQSAEEAREAAARIDLPIASTAYNGCCITVQGSTYALSRDLTLSSIAIPGSTSSLSLGSSGITIAGGVFMALGSGADAVRITPGHILVYDTNGGTVTAGIISNGTTTIPFSIPVESSTASYLIMGRDKSYQWDLTGTTATATLSCVQSAGDELLWAIDIKLGSASSVQYDALMFDTAGSDALTADKVNHCVVRYDGTAARLYCYATEGLT